jgi:hypothetical protein
MTTRNRGARREGLKLEVVAPCPENWGGMPGTEAVRFCGRCRQNVYNLSALTDFQVDQLMSGPRVCVRFFARGDGTVITRSCSPMRKAAGRRALALAAGLIPLAAGFWGSVAWLAEKLYGRPPTVMGGVRPPPRPTMGEPEAAPAPPRLMMGKPVAPARDDNRAPPHTGHVRRR